MLKRNQKKNWRVSPRCLLNKSWNRNKKKTTLKDQMMKRVSKISQKKVVSSTLPKNSSTTKTTVLVTQSLMLTQFWKQQRRCSWCRNLKVIKKIMHRRRMMNRHQMKMRKMICLLLQMRELMITKHLWTLSVNQNRIETQKQSMICQFHKPSKNKLRRKN